MPSSDMREPRGEGFAVVCEADGVRIERGRGEWGRLVDGDGHHWLLHESEVRQWQDLAARCGTGGREVLGMALSYAALAHAVTVAVGGWMCDTDKTRAQRAAGVEVHVGRGGA